MVSEEYSDTLQPGMATPCGPAMRAAIMERAKELGVMDPSSKEKDTTEGIWVLDFGLQKGMLHTCTYSNSEGLKFIPNHEFLRRLENTKPPKKELTTEERLAKAVEVIEELRNAAADVSYYNSNRKNPNLGMTNDHKQAIWNNLKDRCVAASAFLKSIKP
jgi:hypothetical protein